MIETRFSQEERVFFVVVTETNGNERKRTDFLSDFQPSWVEWDAIPSAARTFSPLALGYVLAGLSAPFALSGQIILSGFQPSWVEWDAIPSAARAFSPLALGYVLTGLTAPLLFQSRFSVGLSALDFMV